MKVSFSPFTALFYFTGISLFYTEKKRLVPHFLNTISFINCSVTAAAAAREVRVADFWTPEGMRGKRKDKKKKKEKRTDGSETDRGE